MDQMTSSYSLIPPNEINGTANLADLWASTNGSYMPQITTHNNNTTAISQASPNNLSIQPTPNIAYARRYAASKPPYSCMLRKKKHNLSLNNSFHFPFLSNFNS